MQQENGIHCVIAYGLHLVRQPYGPGGQPRDFEI